MMAFVPTFEPKQPQDAETCITNGEEPESTVLSQGKDYVFIFLVDRSYSMSMCNRMETTKAALKLFIQSLPVGSTFAILNFGSNEKWVTKSDASPLWQYTDENMEKIKFIIDGFRADYGGTNILTPLKKAVELNVLNLEKRIFLLTDGEVSNNK